MATRTYFYVNPGATGTPIDGLTADTAYRSIVDFQTGEAANLVTLDLDYWVYLLTTSHEQDTEIVTINPATWTLDATHQLTFDQETFNRHYGVWDESKYILDCEIVGSGTTVFYIRDEFINLLGMQIRMTMSGSFTQVAAVTVTSALSPNSIINVRRCIIRAVFSGAASLGYGLWQNNDSEVNFTDNIIEGFINGAATELIGINVSNASASGLITNNTIDDCYEAIRNIAPAMIAINNILTNAGATSPVSGTFAAGTNANLTDAAAIGYTVTGAGNVDDVLNATVVYNSSVNGDFRKTIETTDAIDAGIGPWVDSDVTLEDVQGFTRGGNTCDIGADVTSFGRGLSTNLKNAMDASSVQFYKLVELNFSTVLRYTTAPFDISYGGNLYLSGAILTDKMPKIQESLKIKPNSLTLVLNGAAIETHALMLQDYVGIEAEIYSYFPTIGEAILENGGVIELPSSSENAEKGTSTITFKIASHWSNWEDRNFRLINTEDQHRLFPTDGGLDWIGVTDKTEDYWGQIKVYTNSSIFGMSAADTYAFYDQMNFQIVSTMSSDAEVDIERESLPLVYGLSGPLQGRPVFRDLYGVHFSEMTIVYVLCEGTCDSLVDITFEIGNKPVSYTHASVSSYIDVRFHDGSDGQAADSTLVLDSTIWDSNDKLSGICYCAITYTRKTGVWTEEPVPTFYIKGKELYDPRDASTAYSTNPALVLYDYLTSTRYGKGLSASALLNIASAADYCEETGLDYSGGSQIPRFEFSGKINTGQSIKKNVEAILFTMLGHLVFASGKYRLIIERLDDNPVYHFDEDNIQGNFKVSYGKKRNVVYYNHKIGREDNIVVVDDADYLTEDNNRVLKVTYKNPFEQNRYRATNRATTMLKRARQQLQTGLVAGRMAAMELMAGKLFTVSRTSQGWDHKRFRAEEVLIQPDGTLTVTKATEYEPSVYDWTIGTEFTPPADTNHLDPLTVTAPTSAVLTATATEQYVTADGTVIPRIKLAFTATTDITTTHYEVEYKEDTDTIYTRLADLKDVDDVTTFISPVTVGITYDVRVRAVNGLGVTSNWLSGSVTVTADAVIGRETQVMMTDGYSNTSFYWRTIWDSLEPFSISTADVIIAGTSLQITSNNVVGRSCSRSISDTIAAFDYWDSDTRCKFKSILTGAANLTGSNPYFMLGTQSGAPRAAAGFRWKWNSGTSMIDIYGWHYTGTTVEVLIASVADGTVTELEMFFEAGVGITWSVNGTTGSSTSGYPGPTNTTHDNVFFVQLGPTSGGAGGATLDIGEYVVMKEE